MVVFEVRRREAMILRIELSSILSSPSLATATIAWAGAGAGAADLDSIDAASAAAADASDEGVVVFTGELAAVWTSFLTILPAGPDPEICVRSTPRSAATLRASG